MCVYIYSRIKIRNQVQKYSTTFALVHCTLYSISLSSRSGTTVPSFSFIFWTLCACQTVNKSPIMLKSALLDSASSQLSGEKKTELICLHYRPFYNCSSITVDFLAKKHPKRCAHCKTQRNCYSNYFLNSKWDWKNLNGFELQSIDPVSCKKCT